jgi:hypothetical protein
LSALYSGPCAALFAVQQAKLAGYPANLKDIMAKKCAVHHIVHHITLFINSRAIFLNGAISFENCLERQFHIETLEKALLNNDRRKYMET